MKGFPEPGSPSYLERRMRRWLAEAGYYRCTKCDTWKHGVHAIGKRCGPCEKQRAIEKYQRQKQRLLAPKEPPGDWGAKANAYFERQVDPTYYVGLRLNYCSPIASMLYGPQKPAAGSKRSAA